MQQISSSFLSRRPTVTLVDFPPQTPEFPNWLSLELRWLIEGFDKASYVGNAETIFCLQLRKHIEKAQEALTEPMES